MGRQEGKAIGPVRLEKRLVLHSLCQLASWAFVAVLITVLPGVGGENSPCGTISSGTFHQEENNCLPPQLGRDSHQAALGRESARLPHGARPAPCALSAAHPGEAQLGRQGAARGGRHCAYGRCPGAGAADAGGGRTCWLLLRPRLGREGRRTFQFSWLSLAFLGAPGVEMGRGKPPVFVFGWTGWGWAGGGSEGIGHKSEMVQQGGKYTAFQTKWPGTESCLCLLFKLCDLGQVDTFSALRCSHTYVTRSWSANPLRWYWLCYETLLNTRSSQQPCKEVLFKLPLHRWENWVLETLRNVSKVTQLVSGRG